MPDHFYRDIWWCPECERIMELESLRYDEKCPLCSTKTVRVAPVKELISALKAACKHMEREDRCPSRVECVSCFIYEAIGELTVE